jgi:hypothetical protein
MAEKLTIEITGGKALDRKMRELGPRALQAAAGSLYRSSERIMTRSKDHFCPVDTGNLRATGHVRMPEVQGKEVRVVMGYGGTAGGKPVGYAVYVHEVNKNYKNGKQWKYLETPLKEAIPDIVRALREDINDAYETLA